MSAKMQKGNGPHGRRADRTEQGIVLVITLLVMALLSLLGAALLTVSLTEMSIAYSDRDFVQALYNGEAGLEESKYRLSPAAPAGERITAPQNPATTWGWYILSGHTAAELPALDPAYDAANAANWSNSLQNLIQWGLVKIRPKLDGAGAVVKESGFPVLVVTSWGELGQVRRRLEFELHPIVQKKPGFAAFGKKDVKFTGNACTDSYDSKSAYGPGNQGGLNGALGTDGTNKKSIHLKGHSDGDSGVIKGKVSIGPGGDPDVVVDPKERDKIDPLVPDPKVVVADAAGVPLFPIIPTPADAKPLNSEKQKNDLKLTGGTKFLAEGVYWVHKLDLSGDAQLITTGSVTLFVKKSVKVAGSATLAGFGYVPGNLVIYVGAPEPDGGDPEDDDDFTDAGYEKGKVKVTGTGDLHGVIIAPDGKVKVSGGGSLYGSIYAKAVKGSGGGCVHYDEALDTVGATLTGYSRSAWHEASF